MLELAVYGDEEVERALRSAFDEVSAEAVEPGWEDRWKSFHQPVVIRRLWVGPPWATARKGLVPVVIDPGRAFGTGAHPTTRLCLELLQEIEPGSLLDAGCGSGVLAIAAAKIGFGPILAVDNDPEAIEATARNAEENGVVLDEVRVSDVLADPLPPTDVAVCNIGLPVLEELAPRLECGLLVASGFLETDDVRLDGYEIVSRHEQGEWAAVVARAERSEHDR
jgi:ribosomal protein L11 methyltransferase